MRVLAPLLQVGKTLGELVRPVPYRVIQTLLDGSAAPGNGTFWRSVRLSQLSDAAIEDLVSLAESLPNPPSFLTGWMIGGAASRIAPNATALGQREIGFEFRLIAMWPPEDPDAAQHVTWVHQGWERLRVYGHGRAYPTFLSDEGLAGVRAAYQEGWSRLVGLKNRYDPTNVFWLNANIPPPTEQANSPSSPPRKSLGSAIYPSCDIDMSRTDADTSTPTVAAHQATHCPMRCHCAPDE